MEAIKQLLAQLPDRYILHRNLILTLLKYVNFFQYFIQL